MTLTALLCSPRFGGTSDTLARLIAEGAGEAGCTMHVVPLREYCIAPCIGCGACARPPHACVLHRGKDQAEELFSLLTAASALVIAAPIYFYALPAGFKALIDRSQRFWAARDYAGKSTVVDVPPKPVLACLAAGRPRGEQLFSGALLTLKYFLEPLHAAVCESRLLRGLEKPADITPELAAALREQGRHWGQRWGQQGAGFAANPAATSSPNPSASPAANPSASPAANPSADRPDDRHNTPGSGCGPTVA